MAALQLLIPRASKAAPWLQMSLDIDALTQELAEIHKRKEEVRQYMAGPPELRFRRRSSLKGVCIRWMKT